MIHSEIKTDLSPKIIWSSWKRAFEFNGSSLKVGEKGKAAVRFQILDVIEGKSYTIVWKSLFTKISYTYQVSETQNGSHIQIFANPKGFFFWIVHLTLKKKIQKDLETFLSQFVQALKNQA